MSSTVDVKCQHCQKVFSARVADRKRGWAKFCSKRCKAKKQVITHGMPISFDGYDDYEERNYVDAG